MSTPPELIAIEEREAWALGIQASRAAALLCSHPDYPGDHNSYARAVRIGQALDRLPREALPSRFSWLHVKAGEAA